MTDFEKIISFENLYRAHRRARLSKRHKKEVVLFEMELSKNLWQLHYDLKYGRYTVGGYHTFTIYDPKEREIQAIGYRDRVLQHSLCDNYLTPLIEKTLIYDNAACRKNKGTHFVIARFKYFLRRHYARYGREGYFVKLDIKKYFDSIRHDILKEKLGKLVKDDRALALLYGVIDSYHKAEGKGLPMGNQTSQCFALLYLDDVDKFVKHTLRIEGYVWYMDDMIFLTDTKQKAQAVLKRAGERIQGNGVLLNEKSQIVAVKNGISFLGWRFFLGADGQVAQKVKRSTKQRIFAKLKERAGAKLQASLASYQGFFKSGNAFYFCQRVKSFLGASGFS